MRRLPEAKGPTWAWALLFVAFIAGMAYLRLVIYPDRIVPLAYGIPLLLLMWRRDLRLLWVTSAAFAVILASKWYNVAVVAESPDAEAHIFFLMQLAGLLATAVAVHFVIVQTRAFERASSELQSAYAHLEATNEELAAREEEIAQQNDELQAQAVELEHQAEEVASQAEELQATNDQLLARERTLDEIIALSASGAGEESILLNLGRMVERLLAPRAAGAAILEIRGASTTVHPLFGVASPSPVLQTPDTFASILADRDAAAYVADLALRPDLSVPTLVTGARPRSVVAAPARLEGSQAISFEVYASEPGEWSDLQLQLAQWCAEQCGRMWTTARLREELARLADSERTARTEAERSAREKDEFVATLAHEMRTPLGAVLGWASLLRTSPRTPEALEKGLEVIERNARQQSRLIADLLDMSRAVSGKLVVNLEPLDLSAIVNAAVDEQSPAAEARGIALSLEADPIPIVLGDAGRLQQVIGNVLGNALKFTPKGGAVRVVVRSDGVRADVIIHDTGKGIRPDIIERLFERYRQADPSSQRSQGGLGLGLAIARHIVDLHGGTVTLASEGEGLGTTCTISIPLLAGQTSPDGLSQGAPGAHDAEMRRRLAGLPVLVIDDDADTLEFVARLLEEYGARVRRAHSATDALATISAQPPGLIVSDIGMPEMDGYELIRRVRQRRDALRDVPAIAMTAFTRQADRARALEAGFQLHVTKPLDAAMLLAAVRRVVSPRGADTTLAQLSGEGT